MANVSRKVGVGEIPDDVDAAAYLYLYATMCSCFMILAHPRPVLTKHYFIELSTLKVEVSTITGSEY